MAATPDHIEVDVRLAAELTVIRPGDKVLVRMPRDLRLEQAMQVAERLRERLPDVEFLVIAGVDGIDVYRPDETT
ncbi:hypothetical protein [Streptomyces umbrinus]|uniref:hypothetical protein n=1 Tax=Streptomyces umbrinus TaxID=67370 RepID=UPI0034391DC7